MVSSRAIFCSTSTSFTVESFIAILVKNTVIMGFFKGVELTIFKFIASLDAVL